MNLAQKVARMSACQPMEQVGLDPNTTSLLRAVLSVYPPTGQISSMEADIAQQMDAIFVLSGLRGLA